MGAPSKIDRLIELGLNRYGAGDLEGALLVWEEALAIDPNNAQANSYVDYVRLHYEMLSGEPEVAPGDAPFAIEEEPEYQIEVSEGELAQRGSQPALLDDEIDGGWFDDEVRASEAQARAPTTLSDAQPEEAIEMEAELPESVEIEAELPPGRGSDSDLSSGVSFEDATREYYGSQAAAPRTESDFADSGGTGEGTMEFQQEYTSGAGARAADFQQEYTGGFTSEGSSLGFSTQETGVRKRDLGFVQPLSPPVPVSDRGSGPLSIGASPTMDGVSLGTSEKTFERGFQAASSAEDAPDEDDLLATLPNPRRPAVKPVDADPPVQPSKVVTKDLPGSDRRPAKRDSTELSQAEVMLNHAPTKDFDPARVDITAPTRDLGLRQRPGSKSDPIDDDAPTKQSDVRAIREAAAQAQSDEEVTRAATETRSDIALAFDPIDARANEILAEIDAGAPPDEPRDDQTRRRVAALLERAVVWLREGDTEKAVSAVDLAMSEDPNSALGQKLITRHRDTILSVFQGYIGDLERMPQLARPLHELQDAPISPRAAFLLSRIDGTLTIDELLDVSGMPRIEAYRHLCQLYLRGILR